jgi:quinol monooxygenase YgiN
MPVERFGGSDSITFVATVSVKPEHEADYVALMASITDTVLRQEPDTTLYVLHSHPTEPHTYVVVERYQDADALRLHGEAPYLAEALQKTQDWISKPIEALQLSQILPT